VRVETGGRGRDRWRVVAVARMPEVFTRLRLGWFRNRAHVRSRRACAANQRQHEPVPARFIDSRRKESMKPRRSSEVTRRAVVKTALAAPVGAQTPPPRDWENRVQAENWKPSAPDWQLTNVRLVKPAGFRSRVTEGYSHQSIEAGDTLRIMASADPPGRFRVEIFRMGYYGGAGARLMTVLGPFEVKTQPDPSIGPNRLRECQWEPSVELKIPTDWLSGVYLGRLTRIPENANTHAWQSFIVFVVRDRRRADVLFQVSDNAWQAYNRWPDDYSMYTDPRPPWAPGITVSFDRPYGKYGQIYEHPLSVGSGEFQLWEFPLCYWLEQQGYDVTYCSNSDMIHQKQIQRTRVFLSVGHDEYWDLRQYRVVEAGITTGVTTLFLAGNAVCVSRRSRRRKRAARTGSSAVRVALVARPRSRSVSSTCSRSR